MTLDQHRSIDENEPIAPPTNSRAINPREQYQWILNRFTAPDWSVTELRFVEDKHTESSTSVIEAALTHESGSMIHVVPFDPAEHQRDSPIYQANRVRLRDQINGTNRYVTVKDSIGQLTNQSSPVDHFISQQSHPFPDATNLASFHEQAVVHAEDHQTIEEDPDGTREYAIATIKGRLIAVFGAAQSVTSQHNQQTHLGNF